jgi:hypothetical protein
VAVKCDLCRDVESGPACVSACPVEAIARIRPSDALDDVRIALGRAETRRDVMPRRRAAWPWVLASVPVAIALARADAPLASHRFATGIAAGALVLALAAYVVTKRVLVTRVPARPSYVAHVGLGVLAAGAVAVHAGWRWHPNAGGALALAFWVAAALGGAAGLAYRFVPRALTRIERAGRLPEDLAAHARELDDRAFRRLSGRSDTVKAIYARFLQPYGRAWFGPVALVLRGARLREEERRVRARIDAVLGGQPLGSTRPRQSCGPAVSARLDGLDDLVRLVVERRAVPAQIWMQRVLRGLPALHVVVAAIALVFLALHVAYAWRFR